LTVLCISKSIHQVPRSAGTSSQLQVTIGRLNKIWKLNIVRLKCIKRNDEPDWAKSNS